MHHRGNRTWKTYFAVFARSIELFVVVALTALYSVCRVKNPVCLWCEFVDWATGRQSISGSQHQLDFTTSYLVHKKKRTEKNHSFSPDATSSTLVRWLHLNHSKIIMEQFGFKNSHSSRQLVPFNSSSFSRLPTAGHASLVYTFFHSFYRLVEEVLMWEKFSECVVCEAYNRQRLKSTVSQLRLRHRYERERTFWQLRNIIIDCRRIRREHKTVE